MMTFKALLKAIEYGFHRKFTPEQKKEAKEAITRKKEALAADAAAVSNRVFGGGFAPRTRDQKNYSFDGKAAKPTKADKKQAKGNTGALQSQVGVEREKLRYVEEELRQAQVG